MALYLGSNKQKLYLDGVLREMNLYSQILITNGIVLISSDDFTLKSSDGLYLTTIKESDNYGN